MLLNTEFVEQRILPGRQLAHHRQQSSMTTALLNYASGSNLWGVFQHGVIPGIGHQDIPEPAKSMVRMLYGTGRLTGAFTQELPFTLAAGLVGTSQERTSLAGLVFSESCQKRTIQIASELQ